VSKFNFSVRIEVDSPDTPTDTSIGLVNGVFEWFLGGSFPDTAPYIYGKDILARDGISPISKSVKVERFGDIANIDGLNITIKNTEIFWKKFLLAFGENYSLHGSRCFIIEWIDGAFQGSIYAGVCDIPSFDKSTYNIPVRSSQEARDSNLGFVITEDFKKSDNANLDVQIFTDSEAIGESLPLTIGENEKTFFLQTGDRAEIVPISSDTETNYVSKWISGTFNDLKVLVVSASFGLDLTNLNALMNEGFLYFKCIQGLQEGNIGKVVNIVQGGLGFQGELTITLEHNFSAEPDPLEVSLYQFVDVRKEYNSDFWKCEGFFNSQDQAITSNAQIYSYDNGYKQLPSFAVDINQDELNDNELKLNESEFEQGFDGALGFSIQQSNNIAVRNTSQYLDGSGWTFQSDLGLYYRGGGFGDFISKSETLGDVRTEDGSTPFIYDGAFTSVGLLEFSRTYELSINEIFKSSIPDSFENCYMILNSFCRVQSTSGNLNGSISFKVKTDKWYGDIQEVVELNETTTYSAGANQFIDNFASNYSTNGLNDNSFWGDDGFADLSGYKLIDLGISNIDEFLKFNKIVFVIEFTLDSGATLSSNIIDIDIEQLGFVFTQKSSLEKGLYTNFKGRLYDTDITSPLSGVEWQSNDLIKDPIGALAHVKLLQNYSNLGVSTPANGWGKGYTNINAQSYLNLDLDTNGSYLQSELDLLGWYGVEVATQITDNKSLSSRAVSKDICNRFFLISWVGDDFKERVTQVAQKTTQTGLEQIDQTMMLSWGQRVEQDSRNIFCEPVVNYAFDVGSKKFTKSMAITNTGSDLTTEEDQANACQGMDFLSQEARAKLWRRARALFLYYGVINEPPKILSNHTWINKDQSAYWYIRKWLSFMGSNTDFNPKVIPRNKFNFKVPYEIGKFWDIGKRLEVKLPNITDDLYYEFLITGITKNVSDDLPSIDVEGILFDLDVRVDNAIQDSFDDSLELWQDTTDENNENIQDEV